MQYIPQCSNSFICLFLHPNLDFLCAIRTPPYNSWKNQAEHIMSLLNLALQGVGVVCRETRYEDNLNTCKNMKQIRELATQLPEVKEAIKDSLKACKVLLYSLFSCLKLKGEPLTSFNAASDEEIHELWEEIKKVDDTVAQKDTNAKSLQPRSKLQDFFQTHCKCRHYMFSVKKCTNSNCTLCNSPRLPPDVFQS